ncbi:MULTISPECIES: amino acid permease [unclassified Streptomyces]|uniref:amino acid permease n=1 Tax=unclassified Streptomyces TaxID=2593676 RepID=UPI002E18BA94
MRLFGGAVSAGLPAPGTGSGHKGLKNDALGMFSSVVMGLASTGPAYSLAATLGIIVAGVGLQAPIVTMLAFVPMLLVAYAFRELNASNADCGTTFTWATRAFGPRTGWMGGWGLIVANIIVMASLAQIAAAYGFRLMGLDALAENRLWTTAAGVGWIAVLTVICYVGISLSVVVQRWLLCLEVVMLILLAVAALVRVYVSPPPTAIHVSASWFNPFAVPSVTAMTSGILAGVFLYWGWDTAFSVNEETVDSTRIPGRAAVLSTVLLLVMYGLVSTSAQAFAGVGTSGIGLGNADNADDVFSGPRRPPSCPWPGLSSPWRTILNTGFLRKAGVSEERITAVSSWQDAPYFTDAERAALSLVEATLQPAPHGQERVTDDLYAEVAKHYEEKALATLTVAIGQINFFIALAVIGKPAPVASLADEQWD